MIVETFKPEHLETLILQPAQVHAYANISDKGYGKVLSKYEAYTAFVDGRVVACAGTLPIWDGRAEVWSLVASDIGKLGMRSLHFAVKRWLACAAFRRLEAHCDAGFLQAHRWLMLLGFVYEGPLAKYLPDGRDCIRFARVR